MYLNAVVDERLLVAVVAVQQQTGATECGVMAIANGYHAVCGDDLSKVSHTRGNERASFNMYGEQTPDSISSGNYS